MKQKRIQRKRTKGWKMPPNTVYVGRPSRWGNPFHSKAVKTFISPKLACDLYRVYLKDSEALVESVKKELKGKNLACYCFESWHCHADTLLEIANKRIRKKRKEEKWIK